MRVPHHPLAHVEPQRALLGPRMPLARPQRQQRERKRRMARLLRAHDHQVLRRVHAQDPRLRHRQRDGPRARGRARRGRDDRDRERAVVVGRLGVRETEEEAVADGPVGEAGEREVLGEGEAAGAGVHVRGGREEALPRGEGGGGRERGVDVA